MHLDGPDGQPDNSPMVNYITKIFGASPVAPLQEHMDTCYKAASELITLFEKVVEGDWDAAKASREKIVALEQEADEIKKQIRAQLPKNLFMPVPREDLLNLLWAQDQIANKARDVSGLVYGRKMEIPKGIRKDFIAYVSRNADAAKKARKSIRELDELYETGFRGAEAEFVASLVEELDEIENDTDSMQAKIRAGLFAIEEDLPPVDVVFLYRVIELTGEVGDMAERIGRRLELLLSH
jgi:predicted phosphate transport protein (TIGR00153 family)